MAVSLVMSCPEFAGAGVGGPFTLRRLDRIWTFLRSARPVCGLITGTPLSSCCQSAPGPVLLVSCHYCLGLEVAIGVSPRLSTMPDRSTAVVRSR